MAANQNMNKTSMKHVQQHFLFKTASKVTEMFPKTLLWLQIGDIIDSHISWPWKHFFASKIVLRVIVCYLRSVGSMSSSRRVLRSCHRTGDLKIRGRRRQRKRR